MYHKQMPTGSSDRTLKKAIKPIVKPLAKVLRLRPVTWRWKESADVSTQYGFIAQEVEKVIPEVVSEGVWKDGTTRKFLTTDAIMPYLVGAIHEQQKQIDELKQQIEEREGRSKK